VSKTPPRDNTISQIFFIVSKLLGQCIVGKATAGYWYFGSSIDHGVHKGLGKS